MLFECWLQFRGEAGERQLARPAARADAQPRRPAGRVRVVRLDRGGRAGVGGGRGRRRRRRGVERGGWLRVFGPGPRRTMTARNGRSGCARQGARGGCNVCPPAPPAARAGVFVASAPSARPASVRAPALRPRARPPSAPARYRSRVDRGLEPRVGTAVRQLPLGGLRDPAEEHHVPDRERDQQERSGSADESSAPARKLRWEAVPSCLLLRS